MTNYRATYDAVIWNQSGTRAQCCFIKTYTDGTSKDNTTLPFDHFQKNRSYPAAEERIWTAGVQKVAVNTHWQRRQQDTLKWKAWRLDVSLRGYILDENVAHYSSWEQVLSTKSPASLWSCGKWGKISRSRNLQRGLLKAKQIRCQVCESKSWSQDRKTRMASSKLNRKMDF